MASEDSILKAESLEVIFGVYGGEARVLNGVDMKVRRGETVALVGESGSGKTITAKAILGLLPPSAKVRGRILLEGEDIIRMNRSNGFDGERKITLIPQDPMASLNPVFTIREQMTDVIKSRSQSKKRFGLSLNRIRHSSDHIVDPNQVSMDMLERVGIQSSARVLRSYPHELSGGMRQRVLIAMALLCKPSLLLADEPGTALDVTTQDLINSLFKQQIEEFNLSVLYITHSLAQARQISQRTYVMYAGEIAEYADTEEILRRPIHPYTRGLIESIPKLTGAGIIGINGTRPDYLDPPTGCRFHPRCGYASDACKKLKPRMTEVSRDHYVGCYFH